MNRVLVAVALLLPATYLVLWGPPPLLLVAACAVGVLCFVEFARISVARGATTPVWFGAVAGVAVVAAPRLDPTMFALLVCLGMAVVLFTRPVSAVWGDSASLALGLAYCFLPFRSAVELRAISPYWLAFALAVNWVGDVAALYCGRALGRHKLAPAISPGKTWEGAVASALASMALGMVLAGQLGPAGAMWRFAALGLAANLAGQAGDLAESALKRGAGIKDSGSMLGSHGGWLDRMDSSLFTIPVVHAVVGSGWW
jgi:phosphatidate cytidylyltransferase